MEKIHCRKVIEIAVLLTEPQTTEALHKQFLFSLASVFHSPARLYRSAKPSEDYLPIARIQGDETQLSDIALSEKAINNHFCNESDGLITCSGSIHKETDKQHELVSLSCRAGFYVHLVLETELSIASRQHVETLFQLYVNQLGLLWHGMVDNLTGLMNRQTYEEKLTALSRHYHQLSLKRRASDHFGSVTGAFAILDIDHFKDVNDTYGHFCGDEVLAAMAEMMRHFFRDKDLLFRYGGEEFVIVLMDVDTQDAKSVLNRFLMALENKAFDGVGRVTASIGYTDLQFSLPHSELFRQADQALYFSKTHGRNRVTGFSSIVVEDATHNQYAFSA